MNHFRIRVLDHSRKVVFEQVVDKAPNPRAEIVPQAVLAETKSEATGDNQPLIVRLPRNPLKDVPSRYRVSVASRLADLGLEEKRQEAMKLTDPWAMLAAAGDVLTAVHILNNDWKNAAANQSRLTRPNTNADSVPWMVAPILWAYAGEAGRYRESCQKMVERFRDSTFPDDNERC